MMNPIALHRLSGWLLSFGLSLIFLSTAVAQQAKPSTPAKAFKGVIKLDVRDSTPDWGPYTPKQAPTATRMIWPRT